MVAGILRLHSIHVYIYILYLDMICYAPSKDSEDIHSTCYLPGRDSENILYTYIHMYRWAPGITYIIYAGLQVWILRIYFICIYIYVYMCNARLQV